MNVLGCGLVLSLLLSGCSMFQPPIQKIEVSAKPIDKPELTLPSADVVRMRKIDWVIITPENFEQVLEDAKKNGRPIVFFALTDQGYENLGLNFSDIRALVQQQQAIIAAYEGYYKESEKALDEANKEIKGAAEQANKQPEPSKWQFWR